MAVPEQVREAGRRLAADLRKIREARGIGAETVLEATRLTFDILEAFDETALVDHRAFNRVYLRSIVAQYARVVGIPEKDALEALEQTLAGEYDGSLGERYLKEGESKAGPSFALVDAPEPASDEPQDEGRAQPDEHTDEGAAQTDEAPDDEGPVAEEPKGESPTDPEESEAGKETDAPASTEAPGTDLAKAVATPPSASRRPVPSERRESSGRRMLGWILALVSVVLLAWLVRSFLIVESDTSGGEAAPDDTAAAVAGEGRGAVDEPVEPERMILGDSIRFDVIAAGEPLDPIRIRIDRDLRRPYWIEHRDTLTLHAGQRITFERELDVAEILMEGFLLSDSLIDETGLLVMTRERGQIWMDSLAVHQASRD